MGMGFAPTWLRQVSPLLHMTTLTTGIKVYASGMLQTQEHVICFCPLWLFNLSLMLYRLQNI